MPAFDSADLARLGIQDCAIAHIETVLLPADDHAEVASDIADIAEVRLRLLSRAPLVIGVTAKGVTLATRPGDAAQPTEDGELAVRVDDVVAMVSEDHWGIAFRATGDRLVVVLLRPDALPVAPELPEIPLPLVAWARRIGHDSELRRIVREELRSPYSNEWSRLIAAGLCVRTPTIRSGSSAVPYRDEWLASLSAVQVTRLERLAGIELGFLYEDRRWVEDAMPFEQGAAGTDLPPALRSLCRRRDDLDAVFHLLVPDAPEAVTESVAAALADFDSEVAPVVGGLDPSAFDALRFDRRLRYAQRLLPDAWWPARVRVPMELTRLVVGVMAAADETTSDDVDFEFFPGDPPFEIYDDRNAGVLRIRIVGTHRVTHATLVRVTDSGAEWPCVGERVRGDEALLRSEACERLAPGEWYEVRLT